MHFPGWLVTLTLALASVSVVAETGIPKTEGFACPPPTQLRRIELKEQGALSENCRDASGVRQGPYRFLRLSNGTVDVEGTYLDNVQHGATRSFDETGRLLYTTEFIHGQAGKTTFTQAGLEALARLSTELLEQDGKHVVVSANGEGGLTMECNVGIPNPGHPLTVQGAQLARGKLHPIACGLLARVKEFPSVGVRLLWADGTLASVEKYRVNQCAAAPAQPSASRSSSREP
jgi:hypothetical protein